MWKVKDEIIPLKGYKFVTHRICRDSKMYPGGNFYNSISTALPRMCYVVHRAM